MTDYKWIRVVFGSALVLALAASAEAAALYWDTGTGTAPVAGTGIWSSVDAYWGTNTTLSAGHTRLAWTSALDDAKFTVSATAAVNGVTANSLTVSAASSLIPGGGSLTVGGGGMSFSANTLVGCDVVASSPQTWAITLGSVTATFTGRISGAALTLAPGTSAFAFTNNPNNAFAGLTLYGTGALSVPAGGTVLGNGGVTLGLPGGTPFVSSMLTINGIGTNSTQIGDLVVAAPATLTLNSTASTNIVIAGILSRAGRGTLTVIPASNGGLGWREQVTFTGGVALINGLLPPWMANSGSKAYLTYGNTGLTNASSVSYFGVGSATQWVNLAAATNLAVDSAAYLLKSTVGINLNGKTLQIGDGTNAGIMFAVASITNSGVSGALDFRGAEAVIYNPASGDSGLIGVPITNAAGLTKYGSGALTISNSLLCAGDITVEGGSLTLKPTVDMVFPYNVVGIGSLTKGGAGSLTLSGPTGAVTALTLNDGGKLTLVNTVYSNQAAVVFGNAGSTLVLTNAQLWNKGATTVGNGMSNVTLLVQGGGPGFPQTRLDCGGSGGLVSIGLANSTGNVVRVDGGGVTGGAVITNCTFNGSGFAVANGNYACNNSATIANGGQVWDSVSVNNAGNGIAWGAGYVALVGANNNSLTVMGGNGFVSQLYKAYPCGIGYGTVTGNVATVDGAGYAGSACWTNAGNTTLTVGSSGATGNRLIVTNGGYFTQSGLVIGGGANSNRVDIVGSGSLYSGDAGNSALYIGTGGATGNVLYVANGGRVQSFTVWKVDIGGTGSGGAAGNSFGNSMIIANGGTFAPANGTYIGYNGGVGSSANGNWVQVTGAGASWNGASSILTIGAEGGGSTAISNWLQVDSGGVVSNVNPLTVGKMSDTNAGGMAMGNFLVITNGGQVVSAGATIIGAGMATPVVGTGVALSNYVTVVGGPLGNSLWNLGNNTLTLGSNLASNNTLTVGTGGMVSNLTTLTVGSGALAGGNGVTISGGQMFAGSVIVGTNAPGNANMVTVLAGGVLDASTLTCASLGNSITNSGGVYQFTSTAPTITPNGFGNIALNNGVISFRNLTGVNVTNNIAGSSLTNISFTGANAFRLNNSTNNTAAAQPQTYTFNTTGNPTNYAGLEMVNGGTAYTNGSVTIGSPTSTNGWLTFSNTTAIMWGPVTNYGTMSVFNSTVTFKQNLTLGEYCTLNLTTNTVAVNGALTLPTNATLTVSSALGSNVVMALFQSSNQIVGSTAKWNVSPGTYRVGLSVDKLRLMLRPAVSGFVFIVE